MGRPTVLDARMKEDVVLLVSAGFSRRAAAMQFGIAASTIHYAVKTDRKFARDLKEALRAGCDRRVRSITNLGVKGWRANAYMLARLMPETYGKPPRKPQPRPARARPVRVDFDKISEQGPGFGGRGAGDGSRGETKRNEAGCIACVFASQNSEGAPRVVLLKHASGASARFIRATRNGRQSRRALAQRTTECSANSAAIRESACNGALVHFASGEFACVGSCGQPSCWVSQPCQ
jgi:hypothetical protein